MTSLSPTPAAPQAPPRVRVLLVEDDPGDARLTQIALLEGSRTPFDLRHETSLARALDWLAGNGCDVMLLDLGLPDAQGLETVHRTRGAAPELPIVVLTGHDDPDFALTTLEGGAQDYIVKGDITGPGLRRAIRYAISRSAQENRVRQAERQMRLVFRMSPEATLLLDHGGRITLANPAAETLFGRHARDMEGLAVDSLLPGAAAALAEARQGGETVRGECRDGQPGCPCAVEWAVVATGTEAHSTFLLAAHDVTEQRLREDELRRQALSDPLTGLANRRCFEDVCGAELARVKRYDGPAALLLLDIDHFKHINDTYGHPVGDDVLRALAVNLRTVLRTTDMAARVGGEEFAVILPATSLPGAQIIAERIRETLGACRVTTDGGVISFTVSLGVTAMTGQDDDLADAMERADRALYRAKHNGRNRVELADG